MTFDGITCHAVVEELNQKLAGGHIKKINQIAARQITFHIYAKGENQLLFLSVDSASARFHLTRQKFDNPKTPPNFCMLLRKHLGQGKLLSIDQQGLDRTVFFRFLTHNELGDEVEKKLVIEVMGKYSNIILLDEKNRVLDAIQRVSHDMSRVRQVYPGTSYTPFPSDKYDPLHQEFHVRDLLKEAPDQGKAVQLFYKKITGFSPQISRELLDQAQVPANTGWGELKANPDLVERLDLPLQELLTKIRRKDFSPCLYLIPKPNYYALPLSSLGEAAERNPSISHIIDSYSQKVGRVDRIGQQASLLKERLSQQLDKSQRKLLQLEKDFEKTETRDQLKEEADLLASVVHTLQRGQREVTVPDFYHENRERTIALDPRKNGWENLENLYHRHGKLKTAHQLLSRHIPKLREEIAYLNQLLTTVNQADSSEIIQEIRSEMVQEGLLKEKTAKRKKQRQEKKSTPDRYLTANGMTIYVGRNNHQNDRLTLKDAGKEDIFLHAKTIPGAHVILKTGDGELTREDLEAAAWLAATNSANGQESVVDVDYTPRKNVYKAKGAKPGMVYYNDFKTLHVNTLARPSLKKQ